jgi:hypothetical protein
VSGHEQFEELSALAAIGQVSGDEQLLLSQHLAACEACRTASAEFAQIVHAELPLVHKESNLLGRLRTFLFMGPYKKRFLRAATARGFSFSEGLQENTVPVQTLTLGGARRVEYAAILTLLVVAVSASIVAVRSKNAYQRLRTAVEEAPHVSSRSQETLNRKVDQQEKLIATIKNDLAVTGAQLDAAVAQVTTAEQQQRASTAESRRLTVALQGEAYKTVELAARLESETHRTAALTEEIQRLQGLRNADGVQSVEQQRRIDELSEQLKAQADVLASERRLLSAGRDIRDLMGARNLHIIDVFDTDLKGKNSRAFGRVFYTEGKSLIFYAFDLGREGVANAKYSFQAWGTQDGTGGEAKNLGIFYVDDKAQRRWVLKIEDPDALRAIDSVFVTLEPFGGTRRPSGRKLLYAYLKNQANHP